MINNIQHTISSTITTNGKLNLSKIRYFKFFRDVLWYSYNKNTIQDPWEKNNPQPTLGIFDKNNDLFVECIMRKMLNLNMNTLVVADEQQNLNPGKLSFYQIIENALSSLTEFDNFLLVQNYTSNSLYVSLLRHIRNAFAHGAFNIVNKNEEEYIEIFDRSTSCKTNFSFQYKLGDINKIFDFLEFVKKYNDSDVFFDALNVFNKYGIIRKSDPNRFEYYADDKLLKVKFRFDNNNKISNIRDFLYDYYFGENLTKDNYMSLADKLIIPVHIYIESNRFDSKSYAEEYKKIALRLITELSKKDENVSLEAFKLRIMMDDVKIYIYRKKDFLMFAEV